MCSFEAIVAPPGGGRAFGETVKVEVETNQSSTQIDPYACAIKVRNDFYDIWEMEDIFHGKFLDIHTV